MFNKNNGNYWSNLLSVLMRVLGFILLKNLNMEIFLNIIYYYIKDY